MKNFRKNKNAFPLRPDVSDAETSRRQVIIGECSSSICLRRRHRAACLPAPTIPARTYASVEDVRERRFANDHLAADERGSSLEESVAIGTHLEVHRELDLLAVADAEPCTLGLLFLPREKIGEHQLLRVAL